jgi:hypothetical protein
MIEPSFNSRQHLQQIVQEQTRPTDVQRNPLSTDSTLHQQRDPANTVETITLSTIQRLEIAQAEWRKVLAADPSATESPVNREMLLRSDNLRTNTFWGDELKEKDEGTLRVYAANVNGLSLD